MPIIKKVLPPLPFLKECFIYNAKTGELKWRVRPENHFVNRHRANLQNSKCAGKEAGSLNPDGYRYVGLSGTLFMAHRIIWVLVTGEEPQDEIDHVNRNRSDNKWENLRAATSSQNRANNTTRYNNTSGYRGVCFDRKLRKYRCAIGFKGKKIFLGLYEDPEEASLIYERKAQELFGSFLDTTSLR